jgi:hypothetical protein
MTVLKIARSVAFGALLLTVGCGGHSNPAAPTDVSSASRAASAASPDIASDISAAHTASHGGGGGGGSATETLTGPAINGVVPSGTAVADMSQFSSGGSTTLTVTIRNVNLADGVPVQVTFDFKPLGTITLSNGGGRLVSNLGHFGVSFDQVRINKSDGTTILSGGSFR